MRIMLQKQQREKRAMRLRLMSYESDWPIVSDSQPIETSRLYASSKDQVDFLYLITILRKISSSFFFISSVVLGSVVRSI